MASFFVLEFRLATTRLSAAVIWFDILKASISLFGFWDTGLPPDRLLVCLPKWKSFR
jgi:hypothetical protein